MRALSDTLEAAQKQPDAEPLLKIVLSDSVDTYTYDTERILDLRDPEEPDSQTAEVLLENDDGVLTDLDLTAFEVVISKGFLTSEGEEYSAKAPLYVLAKQTYSTGGQNICRLSCCGIFNLMSADQANADYIQESDDDNTIKDLLKKIAGSGVAILDCFDECECYDIVFDSEDSLIDSFKPKDSFSIKEGESRLTAFNELLGYTGCVKRIQNDGKIHIFVPTTTGTSYDYVYYALKDYEHSCFEKTVRDRIVIPNYVLVHSHPTHEEQYSGFAKDDAYDSLPTKLKKHDYKTCLLYTSPSPRD